jgi:GNAT superfamily N-acetyltransferase
VPTTTAPTKPGGNRWLEPNGPEDAVCAVPGSFSLIDRQGCEVLFRPLVQADRPTVARLFPALSALTRFRRFNSLYANLTDKQLTLLFDLDYHDRFAWAVEIACDEVTVPVAVGRYAPCPGSRHADIAITIRDEWHGRGLGAALLDTMIITAHPHGFVAFQTIGSGRRDTGHEGHRVYRANSRERPQCDTGLPYWDPAPAGIRCAESVARERPSRAIRTRPRGPDAVGWASTDWTIGAPFPTVTSERACSRNRRLPALR